MKHDGKIEFRMPEGLMKKAIRKAEEHGLENYSIVVRSGVAKYLRRVQEDKTPKFGKYPYERGKTIVASIRIGKPSLVELKKMSDNLASILNRITDWHIKDDDKQQAANKTKKKPIKIDPRDIRVLTDTGSMNELFAEYSQEIIEEMGGR